MEGVPPTTKSPSRCFSGLRAPLGALRRLSTTNSPSNDDRRAPSLGEVAPSYPLPPRDFPNTLLAISLRNKNDSTFRQLLQSTIASITKFVISDPREVPSITTYSNIILTLPLNSYCAVKYYEFIFTVSRISSTHRIETPKTARPRRTGETRPLQLLSLH